MFFYTRQREKENRCETKQASTITSENEIQRCGESWEGGGGGATVVRLIHSLTPPRPFDVDCCGRVCILRRTRRWSTALQYKLILIHFQISYIEIAQRAASRPWWGGGRGFECTSGTTLASPVFPHYDMHPMWKSLNVNGGRITLKGGKRYTVNAQVVQQWHLYFFRQSAQRRKFNKIRRVAIINFKRR